MSKEEMIAVALRALAQAGYNVTKTPAGYMIFSGAACVESGLGWQALYAYSVKVTR